MDTKVITTLFADNKTVYLSEYDNFCDLNEILKTWCIASEASFNVEKTEVISIGSKMFHEDLIKNRINNANHIVLNNTIHIAKEGEPIQILGAWIRNQIDNAAVWTKTIDKIKDNLEH